MWRQQERHIAPPQTSEINDSRCRQAPATLHIKGELSRVRFPDGALRPEN
nr:MAG TPA: hypothetical protein [Caudoviricetes sp.]